MVVFKKHDSVPSARYSSVCNVLRQWRIWLIPTYRVYRLYDIYYIIIFNGLPCQLKRHLNSHQPLVWCKFGKVRGRHAPPRTTQCVFWGKSAGVATPISKHCPNRLQTPAKWSKEKRMKKKSREDADLRTLRS